MRNYVQPGDTLTIPAADAILFGDVVIAGEIIGIAAGSAAPGDLIDVATVGVFEVPKVAADAIVLGDAVFYGLVTSTAGDNPKLGVAVAAAPAASGMVRVRLSGF